MGKKSIEEQENWTTDVNDKVREHIVNKKAIRRYILDHFEISGWYYYKKNFKAMNQNIRYLF